VTAANDDGVDFFTGTYTISEDSKRLNLVGTFTLIEESTDVELDGYISFKGYNATDNIYYGSCFVDLDPRPEEGDNDESCSSNDLLESLFVLSEAQADSIIDDNIYVPTVDFDPTKFVGQTIYQLALTDACDTEAGASDPQCSENTFYKKQSFVFSVDDDLSIILNGETIITGAYSFSDGNTRLNIDGVTADGDDVSASALTLEYNERNDVYAACFLNEENTECDGSIYDVLFVFDEAQADAIISANNYEPSF